MDDNSRLKNAYYRLGELIALMSLAKPRHTLTSMQKILGLPIHVLRHDMMALLKSNEFGWKIEINPSSSKDGHSNDDLFNVKENMKNFYTGDYDQCEFFLKTDENYQSFLQIPEDVLEALQTSAPFICERNSSNLIWDNHFEIKSLFAADSNYQKEIFEIINHCIHNSEGKYPLKASYASSLTGNPVKFPDRFIPFCFFHDTIYGEIYVVTVENNVVTLENNVVTAENTQEQAVTLKKVIFIPLANISSITKDYGQQLIYKKSVDKKVQGLLKYLWGPETILLNDTPQPVKLRVEKNQLNVLRKIRLDLSGRSGVSEHTIEKTDERTGKKIISYYEYDIEVLGLKSFTAWVLSYGSSVTVLEPEFLRDDITKIYRNVKDMHEVIISDRTIPRIEDWQNRRLADIYPVLYIDAIHFSVGSKEESHDLTVHIILGINLDGWKDVLSIQIWEKESMQSWVSVLNSLKKRGLKDILFVCAEELTDIREALSAIFPNTEFQLSIVHQTRNSLEHVEKKERIKVFKPFITDLKTIYLAPTEKEALEALEQVSNKWSKYPASLKIWTDNWAAISPIFRFSPDVRKKIFVNHIIDELNAIYRKLNRQMKTFPNDTALLKTLYLSTFETTKKWTKPIRNWEQVYKELNATYKGRFPE